ncbi:MAG: chemotaxis protein CheX [Hyphomonadaceae bacterium]|nr:chemotaxis protein CheX [Hyphomonadaceae bacterium]
MKPDLKPDLSPLDHEITAVLQVVEQRTISFFRDELGLVSNGIDRRLLHEERVVLRAMTAIVAVGSRAGLYIAYSYDESLIRAMARRYTEGLSISPDEEELYVRETASDVVNVIVGNCTADLARRGETVTLSPPVLMVGARTIQGRTETTIAALTLRFPEGALDVAFVGPRLLFDEQLNYKGGHS